MNPFQAREIWPAGTLVDRKYEIRSTLGRGGFGTVYLATHRVLGHSYVIKRLHSQFAEDPQFINRFVKEAQAIAKLKGCPQIVEVFDMTQTDDGQLILVMEYMPGGDLGALLESEGRLDLPRAVSYARQIAEGLKAVHALGFVHRDVKPQNVLLTGDRQSAKLTDFGIVTDRDSVRTTSVMRTGSEGFAAPEQWQLAGKLLDGRTDLYALGATIYRMLAGRMPYGDLDLRDWVAAIQAGPPPSLRTFVPDVPTELDRLVLQMLEVDRDKRPADADEVIARLDARPAAPPVPVPVQPTHRATIVEVVRPPVVREALTATIQEPAAPAKSVLRFLPNVLTVLRILLASEIFGNYKDDGFEDVDLFLYLGIYSLMTDVLDGWLARRLSAVSKFGAMLDPVADAILIGGTLLMFDKYFWPDSSIRPAVWAAGWAIIAQGLVTLIVGAILWRRSAPTLSRRMALFTRIAAGYEYLIFLGMLVATSRIGWDFIGLPQTIWIWPFWMENRLSMPVFWLCFAAAVAMCVVMIRSAIQQLRSR